MNLWSYSWKQWSPWSSYSLYLCAHVLWCTRGQAQAGIFQCHPHQWEALYGGDMSVPFCLLCCWSLGWAEWAALFMFQDSLLNESASPHSKWLLPWELTHGLPTTVLKYRLISRTNTHKHTQKAAPWLDEINSLKESHFGPGCTQLGPICSVSMLTRPAQPLCNVCKLQLNRRVW